MKDEVLSEIKKQNSRICVIFATTALEMGMDAPNITQNIHITPHLKKRASNKLDVLAEQKMLLIPFCIIICQMYHRIVKLTIPSGCIANWIHVSGNIHKLF